MPLFDFLVGAAVLAVVAFQVWLTVHVFKSALYEKKQKIWQAQLIWLLPIIGAGLVFTILREDQKAERGTSAELKGGTTSKKTAKTEPRLLSKGAAKASSRPLSKG